MSTKIQNPIQPDWWVKSILGAVLSLMLAIGLANVWVVLALGRIEQNTLVQIGMWSVVLLWLPLFFLCFYFIRGWHMLVVMLISNACIYSLIFWLRG